MIGQKTTGVVLGLDYGQKRIGLAILRHSLVEPLFTLQYDDQFLPKLAQIINQEKVTRLVIGVSEGASGERAKSFAAELGQKLNLAIELTDETLSTQSAIEKLRQQKKYKLGMIVDHYAAALLLEDWQL